MLSIQKYILIAATLTFGASHAQDKNFILFSAAKRTALICLHNIQADRVATYRRESAPDQVRRFFSYADAQSCDNVLDQLNEHYADFKQSDQSLFVKKEVLGSTRVGGQLLDVESVSCQSSDCQGLVARIKSDQARLIRQIEADTGTLRSKSLLDNFNAYQRNYVPDTVSKVLNFSSGCSDFGCKDTLWIAVPGATCKYRKISPTNNSESFIDFDKIDLSAIQIEHVGAYTKVTHQRDTLTQSSIGIDNARLKRGWETIRSMSCKGYKKEF